MNIEQLIRKWTTEEIRFGASQGIEPKEMKKGLKLALKNLGKVIDKECDRLQERVEKKK